MLQEITLQYNLCNEPWLKYTMTAVSDRGLKPSQWASARLHSEVLYLETHQRRYELSRVDTSASSGNDANSVSSLPEPPRLRRMLCDSVRVLLPSLAAERSSAAVTGQGRVVLSLERIGWCAQQGETYRWAICKEPLPVVEMRHVGIPLPGKHVDVLHSSLAWEDLQVCTFAQPCTGCIRLHPSKFLSLRPCSYRL